MVALSLWQILDTGSIRTYLLVESPKLPHLSTHGGVLKRKLTTQELARQRFASESLIAIQTKNSGCDDLVGKDELLRNMALRLCL